MQPAVQFAEKITSRPTQTPTAERAAARREGVDLVVNIGALMYDSGHPYLKEQFVLGSMADTTAYKPDSKRPNYHRIPKHHVEVPFLQRYAEGVPPYKRIRLDLAAALHSRYGKNARNDSHDGGIRFWSDETVEEIARWEQANSARADVRALLTDFEARYGETAVALMFRQNDDLKLLQVRSWDDIRAMTASSRIARAERAIRLYVEVLDIETAKLAEAAAKGRTAKK